MKKGIFTKSLLVATLLAMSMTGCGKKDKKDEVKADIEAVDDAATGTDSSIKEDNVSVEDFVQGKDVIVDFNFTVNKNQQAARVYDMSLIPFSDEGVKEVSKMVFDDGKYDILEPYEIMDMDNVVARYRELMDLYGEDISNAKCADVLDLYAMSTVFSNENDRINVDQFTKDKALYEYEGAYESGKVARIQGKINGKDWYLRVISGSSTKTEDYEQKSYNFVDMESTNNLRVGNVITDTENISTEKKNELEEARQASDEFLESLGFSDYVAVVQGNAKSDSNQSDVYGYYFIYGRSFGGVEQNFFDNDYTYVDGKDNVYASQGYITVFVCDGMVNRFCFDDLYKIEGEGSECATLMPFDEVNNIAKDYMQKYVNEKTITSKKILIDRVEFGYTCITYDGDKYSLVPCWKYYINNPNDSKGLDSAAICVNALDGTPIMTYMDGLGLPEKYYTWMVKIIDYNY